MYTKVCTHDPKTESSDNRLPEEKRQGSRAGDLESRCPRLVHVETLDKVETSGTCLKSLGALSKDDFAAATKKEGRSDPVSGSDRGDARLGEEEEAESQQTPLDAIWIQ